MNTDAQMLAFTVDEFCNAYRICKATFYVQLKAGRISARKAGNKTLILKAEAERWANALLELNSATTVSVQACADHLQSCAPNGLMMHERRR